MLSAEIVYINCNAQFYVLNSTLYFQRSEVLLRKWVKGSPDRRTSVIAFSDS